MKFMPHEVMPPAVTDTAPPMLELVNVWKRFGNGPAQTVAVSGVDLRIAKSEFVTLVVEIRSGCSRNTAYRRVGHRRVLRRTRHAKVG